MLKKAMTEKLRAPIRSVTLAIVVTGMIGYASAPIKSASPNTHLTKNQMFAACVVHANQAGSEALVRSEPNTEDEERYFSNLATPIKNCDRKIKNDGHFPGRALFLKGCGWPALRCLWAHRC